LGRQKIQVQSKDLKVGAHLGDIDIVWEIILKWILKDCYMMMWTGFNWLRIQSIGGLL
jgi:hypothetical protein